LERTFAKGDTSLHGHIGIGWATEGQSSRRARVLETTGIDERSGIGARRFVAALALSMNNGKEGKGR